MDDGKKDESTSSQVSPADGAPDGQPSVEQPSPANETDGEVIRHPTWVYFIPVIVVVTVVASVFAICGIILP